jgi:hypothetical protein
VVSSGTFHGSVGHPTGARSGALGEWESM